MITSIEIAQLLQRKQKLAPENKTGFDTALLNLGVALSGKKATLVQKLQHRNKK